MPVADPYLRDCAPAAHFPHFGTAMRFEIDADLVDGGDAPVDEQTFRGNTIGTRCRYVHLDPGHDYFTTGNPACCQAGKPPERFTTLANPRARRMTAAFGARLPSPHSTITG